MPLLLTILAVRRCIVDSGCECGEQGVALADGESRRTERIERPQEETKRRGPQASEYEGQRIRKRATERVRQAAVTGEVDHQDDH